ncbi:hypothetical protein I4U23_005737 [Adineta vaga]|nr:hypothetical protein I4U23_005737 [Adineta vaga]
MFVIKNSILNLFRFIPVRRMWYTTIVVFIMFLCIHSVLKSIHLLFNDGTILNQDKNISLKSLKANSVAMLNSSKALKTRWANFASMNLTKEYVKILLQHITPSSTQDFRRLLQQARIFRDAFNLIETFDIVKMHELTEYLTTSNSLKKTMFSIIKQFLVATSKLESSLFPFILYHNQSALSLKHSFEGKGIVVAVANRQVEMAAANIRLLRFLNCNIPIEVFYNGENDLNFKNRERLQQMFSVQTRDIQELINDTSVKVQGWALKPFALLFSRFTEVILMDADVVFLQDPCILFNNLDYQRTRALFYYDRTIGGPDNRKIEWLSSLFPRPWGKRLSYSNRILAGLSRENQESGVVVVDKVARFCGLLLTCKLNSFIERESVTYKIFYGEKETFWLGQEMIGDDYVFDPQLTGIIGEVQNKPQSKEDATSICGTQIVHFDEAGKILWFNQFVLLNKNMPSSTLARFENYLREPGNYTGYPDFVYCLRSAGNVFAISPHEKDLIKRIGNYWRQEKEITKNWKRF